jgi:putative acetyltransferase
MVSFIGIHGENLEMLFIAGDQRNNGYGKFILNYAVENLNIKKVDVNEQNVQAIGFYKKFSFRTIGRSDKDSKNKNYPILHFSL